MTLRQAQDEAADIARRMKRLRKMLLQRMAMADRADELKAREARPVRSGELAAYDTAALGRKLRPMLEYDGRGWRALAAEIGITSPDLSRVVNGQDVSAAKVFAVCDWAGLDPRRFYRRPAGAPPPRKRARPGGATARGRTAGAAFHVGSTETETRQDGGAGR